MAFQNVHSPVQAPKEHVDKYAFIKDPLRRTYAGMVDIMDEAVGNITKAFKEAGFVSNLFSFVNFNYPDGEPRRRQTLCSNFTIILFEKNSAKLHRPLNRSFCTRTH